MQTDTKKTNLKNTQSESSSDVFASLDNQEVRQHVTVLGVFLRGAVEPYEYEGKTGKTGWLQILQKQRDDSSKLKIEQIKVNESQYGMIDILNKSKTFQQVQLDCVIQKYGDRSTTVLAEEQTNIKLV